MTVLVLGLDLSLTAAGAALLRGHEDGSTEIVWTRTIKADKKGFERVQEIAYAVARMAQRGDGESPAAMAAIEGYSFASKFQGQALGELGGAVKLLLLQEYIPWVEIPPAAWRKELLGKGSLAKDLVRVEAWKRYGLEAESLDALEAVLVGMCAWRRRLGMAKPARVRPARTKEVAV